LSLQGESRVFSGRCPSKVGFVVFGIGRKGIVNKIKYQRLDGYDERWSGYA